MKKLGFLALFVAGGALIVSGVSLARGGDDDGKAASTRLVGYNETPSISTTARGRFEARVADGKITFRLRYEGLEGGNATQAHLHLGQRHTAGGVSAFLCGGSVKPARSEDGGEEPGVFDGSSEYQYPLVSAHQFLDLMNNAKISLFVLSKPLQHSVRNV